MFGYHFERTLFNKMMCDDFVQYVSCQNNDYETE